MNTPSRMKTRNKTNSSPLSIGSLNGNNKLLSSNLSFHFYPIDPFDRSLKKDYVNLNRTTLNFPFLKRRTKSFISALSTPSFSVIQRKKKVFGIKFSKEDKDDIHDKAREHLKSLLSQMRRCLSTKAQLNHSTSEKSLISIKHINTCILKESPECPILRSTQSQVKCFGGTDRKDFELKLIQKQLTDRKYSTVDFLQEANKTIMQPNQKFLKPRFDFDINNNNSKRNSNTNPKEMLKIEKMKIRFKFLSNRRVPQDFEAKKFINDIYDAHKDIANQMSHSFLNRMKVLSKMKSLQYMRQYCLKYNKQ